MDTAFTHHWLPMLSLVVGFDDAVTIAFAGGLTSAVVSIVGIAWRILKGHRSESVDVTLPRGNKVHIDGTMTREEIEERKKVIAAWVDRILAKTR